MPTSSQKQNNRVQQTDPFVYASIFDSFMSYRNPFKMLVNYWIQLAQYLISIQKTHRIAQQNIEHVRQQVSRVESQIAMVNPKSLGKHLDKIR